MGLWYSLCLCLCMQPKAFTKRTSALRLTQTSVFFSIATSTRITLFPFRHHRARYIQSVSQTGRQASLLLLLFCHTQTSTQRLIPLFSIGFPTRRSSHSSFFRVYLRQYIGVACCDVYVAEENAKKAFFASASAFFFMSKM